MQIAVSRSVTSVNVLRRMSWRVMMPKKIIGHVQPRTARRSVTQSRTLALSANASAIIDAYQQLWRVEKNFRMSSHELPPARPTTAPVTRSKPGMSTGAEPLSRPWYRPR